jgi:hypothetical protein
MHTTTEAKSLSTIEKKRKIRVIIANIPVNRLIRRLPKKPMILRKILPAFVSIL